MCYEFTLIFEEAHQITYATARTNNFQKITPRVYSTSENVLYRPVTLSIKMRIYSTCESSFHYNVKKSDSYMKHTF